MRIKNLLPICLLALLCLLPITYSWALRLSTSDVSLVEGNSTSIKIRRSRGELELENSNPGVVFANIEGSRLTIDGLADGEATLRISDSRDEREVKVRVFPGMTVAPTSLVLEVGSEETIEVFDADGRISLTVSEDSTIDAERSGAQITITALQAGAAILSVRDNRSTVTVPISVLAGSDDDDGGDVGGGSGDSSYSLTAWNDLGMHCMDADYSVFAILPPYNNLHAQLVDRLSGELVTTGVSLTYEAVADPDGSINSSSQGKTNFWSYVQPLFGVDLGPDMGLAGKPTATAIPEPMLLHPENQEYVAEGIPITPYDDGWNKNFYPLVKVVASDGNGNTLATARVVLPVSDEMSCTACHSSRNAGNEAEIAAKPDAGWIFDPDPERDYRLNILQLHDERSAGSARYSDALTTQGYSATGLFDTANMGTPILCAGCHASNALPGTGLSDIAPLTEAMHAGHAVVTDPTNLMSLDSSDNRSACYRCHPGSETRCLRGAMGSATEADGSLSMQCQDCHGDMSSVGTTGRLGWLDQPNCQACHHDGMRELSALNEMNAVKSYLETLDQRFASNPDTPAPGFSLFRMSKGHGDLQCEACHGATHAIYPSSHDNDNLLSLDLQGHVGTLSECTVCHDRVPFTIDGGPHGMHTTGQIWVKEHHDYTEDNETACAYCHGADYRGSPLSTVRVDKTYNIGDGRSHSYSSGDQVGCYDCHDGPFH